MKLALSSVLLVCDRNCRGRIRFRTGSLSAQFYGAALLVLVAVAILRPPLVSAQYATVFGVVRDAATGDVLPDANIVLQASGTQRGVVTAANGTFSVGGLTPESWVLMVTYVGYRPQLDTLALAFNERRRLDVRLDPEPGSLEEVAVEASASATRTSSSFRSLSGADLVATPLPGGRPDIAAYMQGIPGVMAGSDQGGQMIIRGGAPTEHTVLVDGIPIFQPFHLVSLFSVVPADVVLRHDLYTGGVPAAYAGRLGAVLDLSLRNGNKRNVELLGAASPLVSGLRVELPVKRDDAGLVGSFRHSLPALSSPLNISFYDVLLRMHAFLDRTSSASLTFIASEDVGDLRWAGGSRAAGERSAPAPLAQTSTRPTKQSNLGFSGTYAFMPETYPAMTRFRFHYSQSEHRFAPGDFIDRSSFIESLGLQIQFDYLLGRTQWQGGIQGQSYRLRYNLGTQSIGQADGLSSGGLFTSVQHTFTSEFALQLGVHLAALSSAPDPFWEPRIQLSTPTWGAWQFSAGWSKRYQQLLAEADPRDATQVFVAWRPVPKGQPIPAARESVWGVTWDAQRTIRWQAEAFYRDYQNLLIPAPSSPVGRLGRGIRSGGYARGASLEVHVRQDRLTLRSGYAFQQVRYQIGQAAQAAWLASTTGSSADLTAAPTDAWDGQVIPPHDRPHHGVVDIDWVLEHLRIGASLRAGSGAPLERIDGYTRTYPAGQLTDPGTWTTVGRSSLDTDRLPAYARLDIRAQRTFTFDPLTIAVTMGGFNLLDRQNLLTYEYLPPTEIPQLERTLYVDVVLTW